MTSFEWDGKNYAGPDIHAENLEDAETIAEYHGLSVDGELTDLIDMDYHSPRVQIGRAHV